MFPIRAKAMEAADRMKSPTKMAWKRKHSLPAVSTTQEEKEGPGFRFSYFSLPPDLVDGSLPPPLIRTVNHVIVHEAGSVDHFWDHSYGSLTREQISEGDGVKGSEMKLGLTPPKKKKKQNSSEVSWNPGYWTMTWKHACIYLWLSRQRYFLYPSRLLWMLSARAIRTTIIGRMAFPLPSK